MYKLSPFCLNTIYLTSITQKAHPLGEKDIFFGQADI